MINQENYKIKRGTTFTMIIIGILELCSFLGSLLLGLVLFYMGFIFGLLGQAFDSANEAIWGIELENGLGAVFGGMIGFVMLFAAIIVVVIGIVMLIAGIKSFKSVKSADAFYKRKGGILGYGIFYVVISVIGIVLILASGTTSNELITPICLLGLIALIGIVKIVFASGVKQLTPKQKLDAKVEEIKKIENQ